MEYSRPKEKTTTINVFASSKEKILKLTLAEPPQTIAEVVEKLLSAVDENSSLAVFKKPETLEKIKQVLPILVTNFKIEIKDDDDLMRELCDFLIDNYKDFHTDEDIKE